MEERPHCLKVRRQVAGLALAAEQAAVSADDTGEENLAVLEAQTGAGG